LTPSSTLFPYTTLFRSNLDNVLLGRYWGASQLGLYSRGYQLMTLPIDQINGPITTVAVPALSRLADSPERYRQAYLRIIEKIARSEEHTSELQSLAYLV